MVAEANLLSWMVTKSSICQCFIFKVPFLFPVDHAVYDSVTSIINLTIQTILFEMGHPVALPKWT